MTVLINVFIASSLLLHNSLAKKSPCDADSLIRQDCIKARDSIKYTPDNKIKDVEQYINTGFQNCFIQVERKAGSDGGSIIKRESSGPEGKEGPSGSDGNGGSGIRHKSSTLPTVTKKDIDAAIGNLFKQCPKSSGTSTTPVDTGSIKLKISTVPPNYLGSYGPNQKMNTAICTPEPKKTGRILQKDCENAFKKIPTDSQGNLIKPDTKQLSARFEIAENSCKLRFSSTDYLPIVESASKLLKLLDSALVTCKKEPSYMAILKGTTGLNGRIKIEVSSNPSPS
ncbi:hypothetical protein PGT21_007426 [Puccinia graminis f. sp. tritici]|uniref:Uncharacterized protein n=1 Tax=Puccinia graminis f. sp. tritici TaxID=56615 RepID=A0A5B0PEK3_PUCGR|nr:hypothetical protein PGT21_007426 [Puccinia graminis f. sp. tritici]KAA1123238.1 hypothetical protein PGTUg99_013610 [Puccinia graminis f. sp. tritici]